MVEGAGNAEIARKIIRQPFDRQILCQQHPLETGRFVTHGGGLDGDQAAPGIKKTCPDDQEKFDQTPDEGPQRPKCYIDRERRR
jgi:hypothetical protein